MSKSNIRKTSVDPTKCNTDSRRPSVFERLGTKPAVTVTAQNTSDYCRNWALNGSCSYGKNCKYANTHILISPSKRAKKDNAIANTTALVEDPFKRLTSKIVKKASHSPDLNLEEWNQTDLEYEDEKVLERRRQLLQRELELQMKKDKEVHGKDKARQKKKAMSSSSSSRTSSSSSSSSSSSTEDSSSSSTSDSQKKVKKIKSKRHHNALIDYDEDKERRKKLKLKRLGTKNEKPISKKKYKVDVNAEKKENSRSAKKCTSLVSRKHSSSSRTKSPMIQISTSVSSATAILGSSVSVPATKGRERNRSESPKSLKVEKDEKHYKKLREIGESSKDSSKIKIKDQEKEKSRLPEEKVKNDDRMKSKCKKSRTPPNIEKPKNHSNKSRRSRTPEKSSRSKREPSVTRNQVSSSSRSRDIEKKDRDPHKCNKSKDRDDTRKNEQKTRQISSQDDHRRARDIEEKNYLGEKRQKSRERREKERNQDDRSHSRVSRDQRDKERERERERDRERDREREKERERDRDREKERERDRDRDREREREREREKEASKSLGMVSEKNSRCREKERSSGKDSEKGIRDRRERERGRSETKDRNSTQRFENRYDRNIEKEARKINSPRERFPRERSLERSGIHEKSIHGNLAPPPPPPSIPNVQANPGGTTGTTSGSVVGTASREHLIDREGGHYDRDRHRKFNMRYDRGHGADHDRKEQSRATPTRVDRVVERRESSPRRAAEIDRNFNRNYGRLPTEHWDEQEESSHLDYRDHHVHEEDRRKPVDGRRFDSPFDERRSLRDERTRDSRYLVQSNERTSFDDHRHHHHHHRHPLYNEKPRPGNVIRDEAITDDDWEAHHREINHSRDRTYTSVDWEEREWRSRTLWENRENRDTHEEEWPSRYENQITEWKGNEPRKWENQNVHIRHYRKDSELDSGKCRSYSSSEVREECSIHTTKQASLYGSMKEEPINKKLMELAEGRLRTSREKSVDSFGKKILPREKSESKETASDTKRSCVDDSLQTLHTESDLSDISDDPDDILNMEEEVLDVDANKKGNKKGNETVQKEQNLVALEVSVSSPKEIIEENAYCTKGKENVDTMTFRHMEDENVEAMDFEEISDGELEEDIKTSGKGLGDALGVDWESLVKETQPRRSLPLGQHSAESRWECRAIFHRIGISVKYAEEDLIRKLKKKYGGDHHSDLLFDDVALMHTAFARNRILNNLRNDVAPTVDDLYRNDGTDGDEMYNSEILKPCISLYEEAKCLLQQVV